MGTVAQPPLTPDTFAPTLAQIDTVLLAGQFRDYIAAIWPVYSPKPFLYNWHIDAIAEHLEAVHRRQIIKLVISMPPRYGKSSIVSVLFPTWAWCSKPETRFLSGSHKLSLAQRDANWSRRLLASKFYRERWGHVFSLTSDQNTKSLYENNRGGRRLIAGVDAHTTGEGGDYLLLDDPLDIDAAMSLAVREGAWDYVDNVWRSRLDPPGADKLPGAMVVTAQRTHEDDVSGHLLKEGGWEHLCIAEEHEVPAQVEVTSIGWRDPRKTEGELLWPERRNYGDVAILKRNPYKWATLYQQRPAPIEGGIIKRHWWRFWTPACTCAKDAEGAHAASCPAALPVVRLGKHTYIQAELPAEWDEQLQSWDMNFKGDDEEGADPGRSRVSGGVWGRAEAQFYLLDRVSGEWGFNETEAQVVELSYKWKDARKKLVEDKANGPAIMARLKRKIGGFVAVTPRMSKVARVTSAATDADKKTRALSMEGVILAGDVYLPHPALAPWVWDFIEECVGADTEIVTAEGLKRAVDVAVGDRVLTHEGRFKSVRAVSRRLAGATFRLKAKTLDEVVVTGGHPALASRVAIDTVYAPEWKSVADLRPRTVLLRRRPRAEGGSAWEPSPNEHDALTLPTSREPGLAELDLAVFIAALPGGTRRGVRTRVSPEWIAATSSCYNPVKRFLPLDRASGRFFGLYAAEGCVSKGSHVALAFHAKETAYHQEVRDFASRLGLEASTKLGPVSNPNSTVVGFNAALIRDLFRSFGTCAMDKRVPEWVWCGNADFVRGFVEGYVDGDGHRGIGDIVSVTSASKSLLWGVRLLLASLGVSTSGVRKGTCKRGFKPGAVRYVLDWHSGQGRLVGHFIDSHIAYSLMDKADVGPAEVFNFDVEGDHSYVTTAGTLHNCALFPNGPHDDDVDMTSQALADMGQRVWGEAQSAHHEAMKLGPEGPPTTTIEIFRRQFRNTLKEEREEAKMTPKRRRERYLRVGRLR